ncbi:bifunctional metallophosphatase/5'-nucleotidase [Halomonadaceae bacterium KBTZ08]
MDAMKRLNAGFLVTLLALLLVGCLNDDEDNDSKAGSQEAFRMQLLHFADVDGTGGLADVRNFSALVNGFRSRYPERTVLVSSGDNLIPGPEFFAAADPELEPVLGTPGKGRANIAWLNELGVQASMVGNHDLDAGTSAFAELIAPDGDWPGARFPYLAANIDFSNDATASLVTDDAQSAQPNTVAGSATVTVNDETVGLVGAAVPSLASITDTGKMVVSPDGFDATQASDLDALAAEIQPAVDELTSAGINKVILLAHMQQLAIEEALAKRLDGVDIIVAGGSNTLLADANDRLREGDSAAGDYPKTFSSATDEPVMLVNTPGDFTYLGRLVVSFNEEGILLPDSVDPADSGAYATDRVSLPFNPISDVAAIADALEGVLQEKDGNVLGRTDTFLDGRRARVRTRETNLGNLTADANLWMARQTDTSTRISLKNGGGIRSAIGRAVQPAGSNNPDDLELLPPAANDIVGKPEGGVSQLDIETSLRFNNELTLLTVTAAELADIVEYSVAATGEGAKPGQFPQVAGIRFTFDPDRQPRSAGDTNQADPTINGNRLRSLRIVDNSGNVTDTVVADGMVQGDPGRTFRLVTLGFLAKCVGASNTDCGDGYPLNGLAGPNRVNLVDAGTDPGNATFAATGSEQDALAEYLRHRHPDADNAFNQSPAVNNRILRQ